MSIDAELQTPSDQRLFAIANAMHSGYTVERIWELTQIDKWFLNKLHGLINIAKIISDIYSIHNSDRSHSIVEAIRFCRSTTRQIPQFK